MPSGWVLTYLWRGVGSSLETLLWGIESALLLQCLACGRWSYCRASEGLGQLSTALWFQSWFHVLLIVNIDNIGSNIYLTLKIIIQLFIALGFANIYTEFIWFIKLQHKFPYLDSYVNYYNHSYLIALIFITHRLILEIIKLRRKCYDFG